MLEILDRISKGKGEEQDKAKLKKIAQAMQKASLCGLGQTASNPVLSTLNYFPEEYDEHINKKYCRAGKCVELLNYSIISDKCVKCGVCMRACPVNAITGDREKGYILDQTKCIKCGNCFVKCKFKAIKKG
jgi:ferredoxin